MNLRGMISPKDLFVGDLSIYCTETDLQILFEKYGPIESIIVKKGFSNKNQSKYGFVTYRCSSSAAQALNELQGAVVLGRPIRIDFAQGNKGKRVSQTAQIQFSFISHQTAIVISEASLRDLFGRFGEVIDVMIKKSQLDKHREVQHGYGFIHYPMSFEGVHSALRAVQSIRHVTVGVVTYDTTLSTSLRTMIEYDLDLWKIWEEMQIGGLNRVLSSQSEGSFGSSSSEFSAINKAQQISPFISMHNDAKGHSADSSELRAFQSIARATSINDQSFYSYHSVNDYAINNFDSIIQSPYPSQSSRVYSSSTYSLNPASTASSTILWK